MARSHIDNHVGPGQRCCCPSIGNCFDLRSIDRSATRGLMSVVRANVLGTGSEVLRQRPKARAPRSIMH